MREDHEPSRMGGKEISKRPAMRHTMGDGCVVVAPTVSGCPLDGSRRKTGVEVEVNSMAERTLIDRESSIEHSTAVTSNVEATCRDHSALPAAYCGSRAHQIEHESWGPTHFPQGRVALLRAYIC